MVLIESPVGILDPQYYSSPPVVVVLLYSGPFLLREKRKQRPLPLRVRCGV